MGLILGRDGKQKALEAATSGTLYVGLLQAVPTDADGMSLATLIGSGAGNEFPINADFYTGRKSVTLGSITVDANGAIRYNTNALSWSNTSGSTVTVAGMFLTDAASGSSGDVLWVGAVDVGTASVGNGLSANLTVGGLKLGVD